MNTTTLASGELQQISVTLFQDWEKYKNEIRMTPTGLYKLLALKRNLEGHARTLQETVGMIAEECGGIPNENGGFTIPDDRKDELQKRLNEFAVQEVQVDYNPVLITDGDSLPLELMDILFAFLEVKAD